jgi:Ran GTPase-activating protein (RanGAP) involved in mRNA processing and transport
LVEVKGTTDLSVFVNNNKKFVPKLKKIVIHYNNKNFEIIKTFAKNFGNTIKSIEFFKENSVIVTKNN